MEHALAIECPKLTVAVSIGPLREYIERERERAIGKLYVSIGPLRMS